MMNENEMSREQLIQELHSLRKELFVLRSLEERRKQAEASLEEHWKRLNKAEEVAHLGSWEMETATGVSKWSDEFYRICGLEPGSVPPTAEQGLKLIHPEDRARATETVSKAVSTGNKYRMEKRIVRPDGTIRYVLSVGEIIYDEEGSPKKLMGSFLDITELKKAELEREKLIEELRSALATVKCLTGLLPICASCKKIRDDTGYWQQVEIYIAEHSDVNFTHGICPDCIRKLYPEFCQDKG